MFFMQQAYYDARPCYVTTPEEDKTHKFRSRHRKKRATARKDCRYLFLSQLYIT